MSSDRNTEAEELELIRDPHEKARRESENGIRQLRAAEGVIVQNLNNTDFRLKQALVLRLHKEALAGIHR